MNEERPVDWTAWQVEEPPDEFVEQVMRAVARRRIENTRSTRLLRASALLAAVIAMASAAALAQAVRRAPGGRSPLNAAEPPGNAGTRAAIEGPKTDETRPPTQASSPQSGVKVARAPGTVVDRQRSNDLRAQLSPRWMTDVERDPHTGLTLPRGSAEPSHNLTKDYIAARVRQDFFPLARVCYESALVRLPALRGRIVIDFVIVGDAKVGGIVDQAKIDEDSDIADAEFATCVRESMLSMVFEPPENDGWVSVTYPILFAPDDQEATVPGR